MIQRIISGIANILFPPVSFVSAIANSNSNKFESYLGAAIGSLLVPGVVTAGIFFSVGFQTFLTPFLALNTVWGVLAIYAFFIGCSIVGKVVGFFIGSAFTDPSTAQSRWETLKSALTFSFGIQLSEETYGSLFSELEGHEISPWTYKNFDIESKEENKIVKQQIKPIVFPKELEFSIKRIIKKFEEQRPSLARDPDAITIEGNNLNIKILSNLPSIHSEGVCKIIRELQDGCAIKKAFEPKPEIVEGLDSYLILRIPMASICKTPPHLIFGEIHSDPTTTQLLTLLAPELKKLGYEDYYEEMIEESSLESELKSFRDIVSTYEAFKTQLAERGFDITKKSDRVKMYQNCDNETYQILENLVAKHPARLAKKQFFQTLLDNRIKYKPIDSARTSSMTDEECVAAIGKRDKAMSDAYLCVSKPVFGKNGLDHHLGIQNQLYQSGKTKNDCIFFNIFTPPETEDWGVRNLFHCFADRTVPNTCPFGVTKIDVSKKAGLDQVAEEVLDQIKLAINSPNIPCDRPQPSDKRAVDSMIEMKRREAKGSSSAGNTTDNFECSSDLLGVR